MGKGILYMAITLAMLGIVFSLGVGMGMGMSGKRIVPEGQTCTPASASATPARSR